MTGTAWWGVLLTCFGCYAQKIAGLLVPPALLAARPRLARAAELLPAALLAALVLTAVAASGSRLVIDARLAGLAVGGLLLWRRAPLLVVVLGAAATAALLRLL